MYSKGFVGIVLSLTPSLALEVCWILAGSSGLRGGYDGVASSSCLGT